MIKICHWAFGLLFLMVSQNVFPMAAQIIIKNNSACEYEYISSLKRDECRKLSSQDVITLPIHPSGSAKGESYIEFYDSSEEHLSKRKSLGLSSFILYISSERISDYTTSCSAVLERKRPSFLKLKTLVKKLSARQNIRLMIANDLAKSELSLIEPIVT